MIEDNWYQAKIRHCNRLTNVWFSFGLIGVIVGFVGFIMLWLIPSPGIVVTALGLLAAYAGIAGMQESEAQLKQLLKK